MIVFGRQILVFCLTVCTMLTLVLSESVMMPSDYAHLDAWCQVETPPGDVASLTDAKDGSPENGGADAEEDPETKVFFMVSSQESASAWRHAAGEFREFDVHLRPGRAPLSSLFRPPRA